MTWSVAKRAQAVLIPLVLQAEAGCPKNFGARPRQRERHDRTGLRLALQQ